jgi:hypothetical protein
MSGTTTPAHGTSSGSSTIFGTPKPIFWTAVGILTVCTILVLWYFYSDKTTDENHGNDNKSKTDQSEVGRNYSSDSDANCLKPGFYEYDLKQGDVVRVGPVSSQNTLIPRIAEEKYIFDTDCEEPVEIYDGMEYKIFEPCRYVELKALSKVHISFNVK